jgi:AbrB family looped-hinge helix DNA binding protein
MKNMIYRRSYMKEIKKGKYIFGTVKVGERGQIVIPKEARDKFGINPGDDLMVLGDEKKGLAIVKMDLMKGFALKILDGFGRTTKEAEGDEESED